MRRRAAAVTVFAVVCGLAWPLAAQQSTRAKRIAARSLKNPVPADEASINLGYRIYLDQCASCHGELADGDSKMSYSLDPAPSNLVDSEWTYGSTDGEIFAVIRDGIDDTTMKPYDEILTENQIWSLVNYLRSIGPAPK
jgi:mono/diheme cytochrome c family protein